MAIRNTLRIEGEGEDVKLPEVLMFEPSAGVHADIKESCLGDLFSETSLPLT